MLGWPPPGITISSLTSFFLARAYVVQAAIAPPLFRVREMADLYLIKTLFRAEKPGKSRPGHPLGGRKGDARRQGMSLYVTGRDQ